LGQNLDGTPEEGIWDGPAAVGIVWADWKPPRDCGVLGSSGILKKAMAWNMYATKINISPIPNKMMRSDPKKKSVPAVPKSETPRFEPILL
jgi:hypothetical protein